MKKSIKTTEAIFPMPVLLIATYNDDDTVDVMNAAWGTMLEQDLVLLNLSSSHKTTENIQKRKAFTISLADAKHVKEADYFGVTSARTDPDKFLKSGLTATKSAIVDAPIINELPLCCECEYVETQNDEYSYGIVGKVVNVEADESILNNGNIDISKLEAIAFDPYTHGYYKVTEHVGNAFKDGLELK